MIRAQVFSSAWLARWSDESACLLLFAIDLSRRKVEILGVRSQTNRLWKEQIARNATGDAGFLTDKRYLNL